MKKLWSWLSSLKLAIVLLLVLLVVLSIGTIVESRAGVDVAQRTVYYAPWFFALQGLFALNVIASIIAHFPWGRQRTGFLVTHAGIIVIFAGAAMTYFLTTEGTLGLWEGGTSNEIELADDGSHQHHALPFDVTLDDFRIDHYPGTMRPANYASRVRITDRATGVTFPVEIWMNHEFTYQGYTLFQSSYQQQGGREASIFRVAKDPGQPVAFVGFGLLVLGMCIVLGQRIAARRGSADARKAIEALGRAAAVLVLAGAASTAVALTPGDVDALRRLPVQHDGRSMPLDTVARETVKKVTGQRAFQGEDPVATLGRWLGDTQKAAHEPVIAIGGSDLAAALGLPGATHAAFMQLVENQNASRLFGQVGQLQQQEAPRRGVLGDAEKLLDRAMWFQKVLQGDLVFVYPNTADWRAKWGAPKPLLVPALIDLSNGPRLQGWPAAAAIDREILYNQARSSRISWVILALSLALSIAGWRTHRKAFDVAAFVALAAGFAAMSWGIGMRWLVAERIPASNMYESLLFMAWGVGLFAVIAFAFIRNRVLVVNAAAGATITMLLVDLLPMDGFIHPMPPVLAGTPWLAIHVPIIMVSYSVLALGVIIAHAQVAITAFGRGREESVERMADLNYWYMFVGSILLIVGIITGSMWAAESWGRWWGWDPKEVWSLVAWLAYMAILHGRVDRVLGTFGVAVASIIAFQTILMTYLGVNYVLGTGLHSYGFGDSPVLTWMVIVAAVEAAFLLLATAAHRRKTGAAGGSLAVG